MEEDHADVISLSSSEDEDYIPLPSDDIEQEAVVRVRRQRRRRQTIPLHLSDSEVEPASEASNERAELEDSDSIENEEEVTRQHPAVSIGDADEESLLSVGAPGQEELQHRTNDTLVEEASDSDSLPSIGDPEEVGDQEQAQVTNGPVAGFRVRVDSNGEEHFEFASDSDEFQPSEEEDPPLNELLGVVPAVEFALPMAVVASVAERTVQRIRQAAAAVRNRGRTAVAPQRPFFGPGGYPDPSVEPQPGTSSSTQGRRPVRRKSRKQKDVWKPKKRPAQRKPKAPPKPLGPLTIHEDWNGNDDYKDYLKRISKTTQHKLYINFQDGSSSEVPSCSTDTATESTSTETETATQVPGEEEVMVGEEENGEADQDSKAAEVPVPEAPSPSKRFGRKSQAETRPTNSVLSGYKLGHVQFHRCGRQEWLCHNKYELLLSYPTISELTLHVSQHPSSSILHLKTKRTLTKEESLVRPRPKLSRKDSERELIFVVTQHFFYHLDPVAVPLDMFSNRALGHRKTFGIDFNNFDMDKQCFTFDIVLLDSVIVGDHDVHDVPLLRHQQIQDVFTNFLGISPPPPPLELEARQKEDIAWFYGQIRKFHAQENLPPPQISLQPSSLKPTLRQYQRDAVHWMLYRECFFDNYIDHSPSAYLNGVNLTEAFLDKMFIPIELTKHVLSHKDSHKTPEIRKAFYNPFTAYICWNRPNVPPVPSGGILCDEMGLGKTVETLALILLNKKQVPEELEDYFNGKVEEEEEDDNSSSWEELPSSFETSDSSDSDDSNSNSRKRKKRGGLRSKAKKVKKSKQVIQKEQPTRVLRNSRRRAASPCEFKVASEDEVEGESSQSSSQSMSLTKPVASTSTSITVADALSKKLKEIAKPGVKKTRQGKAKPPKLFDAMKVIYDAALSEYRYADMAKCTPKFHGRFYEADLDTRECFECICGGLEQSCRAQDIVKCSVCSSSQHAECVGFDRTLKMLFQRLGRSYLCPHCESLEAPFETKSTLIITPQSISHQWIKEIQRHVQNHRLNILFYKGVSTHGYIPPAKLARYDIVITTYSVLSSELDYVDLPHCSSTDGRRFRNPKRFLTIPSPLTSVLWWRVCLDEAQMVEGIGTKMSIMAGKITATHRWCVTGTPVNKGLQDLFGLFVFMRLYPISYDIWWDALVRDAFYRKETTLLYELFGQLIWRNGKQDVLDQLGIPPQKEVTHWLNFSPVETHFYKQQFEICSNRIVDKINRLKRMNPEMDILNARLSSLDRFSLHGLLSPFLELRQACCHPQIVKGQLISLQKGTLTMEELLDRLVKKTQMQCHEDHRLIVAALNGMAGLFIIQNNFKEAADKYRTVLQSAEKHKEHFQTDSLQLLHTIENLAEILDGNHDGIPFTLRDESLRTDAAELRKKYMKKYADAVKSTQDTVTPLSNAVEELREQFTMHTESWWAAVLKSASRILKIDSLIQSLKQDLLDVTKKNVKTSGSLANKFHDENGLVRVLVKNLLEMDEYRDTVLEGLEELQTKDPSEFVESAIRCHLRQKSSNYYNDSAEEDTKCELCIHHVNFLFYESVIFKMDTKDKINRTGRNYQQRKQMGELADELEEKTRLELLQQEAEDLKATTEHVQLINEELRRGTWGDSETEVILKGIHRFARVNKLSGEISENGSVHIKLMEALKKEFKFLRILWRQLFDQVSALDELSQATTRLMAVTGNLQQYEQPSTSRSVNKQLRSGIVEKTLKIQNIHLIGFHEIEPRMQQMLNDHATGQESISLHLGQLLYLKTLKRNGYGKKGTLNTEDCPICSVQLGKEWSVLRCGHSYCSECVKKMCPNALQSFLCPLCRHSMKFADVSFVDTTENEQDAMEQGSNQLEQRQKAREVKGSHSTKVEAIVETLLQLQDSHPGEKCIIFSTWTEVLEIMANALNQNDIKYSYLNQSGKPFHANLQKFKEREDLQVLLMPLTSGAKGLNIIEATHVLLVEPILNLASELQAIGRVHRIGQTKQTFVHRFYVRRTIEEKLFQILKGQDVSSDDEGSLTVKELQQLILTVSNHDDVGWLKTIDQYYYGSKNHIQWAAVQYTLDSVVEQLQQNPDRRFIYVESAFFWRWWRNQGEKTREIVRKLINNGQLEFIMGGWSMNDEGCTHYSGLIDQMSLGLRYLNDTFGECAIPKIGWQIDSFGHSREQANLFAQMGFDGLFVGRIDYQYKNYLIRNKQMEMIWSGSPDSLGKPSWLFTGVLFNYYQPPDGYCFDITCDDEPINDDPRLADYNVDQKVDTFIRIAKSWASPYGTNHTLMTMGSDFHYMAAHTWFTNLDKLIKYVNKRQVTHSSRVNVLYSTPSCYLQEVNKAKKTLNIKTDDFFPYSNDPHAYWSGYFTSRPTFKYYASQANKFLQVCKQLAVGAFNGKPPQSVISKVWSLAEAVAIVQHHDAITGTARQHVTDDYSLRLAKGMNDCEDVINDAFRKVQPAVNLASLDVPITHLKSSYRVCHLLNISSCGPSEEMKDFIIAIYNPLARDLYNEYVRIPVPTPGWDVYSQNGIIPTQIVPISEPVLQIPGRKSSALYELIFAIDQLPGLTLTNFRISQSLSFSLNQINPVFVGGQDANSSVGPEEEYKIENSRGVKIVLSKTTGFLKTVTQGSLELPVKQNFYYYLGMAGNNSKFAWRASGAYVLRPNTTNSVRNQPTPVTERLLSYSIYKGVHVTEVHQIFTNWISQIIRLYDKSDLVELEWLVGPIPIEDGYGKEILTKYSTSIPTNGVFFTDSNGRHLLKRERYKRETYPFTENEKVAGNYYPVPSRILLSEKDDLLKNGKTFVVLNDRSQGGSSMNDGEIELLIHRRLIDDDAFGVGEPLNEQAFGKGLVARGKHWLLACGKGTGIPISRHREVGQNIFMEKVIAFAEAKSNNISVPNSLLPVPAYHNVLLEPHTFMITALAKLLPSNIHLLTVEPISSSTFLLRLEHFYEAYYDDIVNSQPVKISIQALKNAIPAIKSIKETSLGGNQWIEDMKRLEWITSNEKRYGNSAGNFTFLDENRSPLSGSEYIMLLPMQFKTYIVEIH
ncbi:unnamed protein product [Orchesella dallaii]|uniref:E3 ubiquitin-protein ligase SHPRH n=1 Tax=Orchesella dallaii TaxID=48710 RepID=A0ABP1Q397_9HEXA